MDERLRRSAAHVLVGDIAAPTLDEPTRHHLVRVLRLRDGASVTATDGRGAWRACTLRGGALEVDEAPVATGRRDPPVTIAVAPPKGDRLEWLVAKCTEVGVDRIVLLDAERSVVRWPADRAERQLERLRRVAGEAAMQSRRAWLPEVSGPIAAVTFLADAVAAEPGGRAVTPHDTTIAVGPEGGWSRSELDAAGATVALGDTVLRVETAAVAAAVLMTSRR